MVIRHATTVAY